MPNVIKYTTGTTPTGCLRKGNMLIGNNTADYGATFFNGIDPPSGGYTIYLNKASGGPSIYRPTNDTQLIFITKQISGNTYVSAAQCLEYYASQTDKICVKSNYESIVTNGLTLNYDAGFTPSYPTIGNTWYDISSNAYNGTLNNNPTFNSSNNGGFVFDGSDDYVSNGKGFTSLGMGNSSYTAEIWYYRNSTNGADQTLFGCQATGQGYGLHLILRNNYPYFGHYGADTGASTQTTLGFFQVSFVFNKTADLIGNQLIYINGSLNATGTGLAALYDTDAYPVNIGGLSYWGYYAGNIYIARIYNRALSAAEILQNYNAQKGRFGL
jgi:hypothetical protein